jgi:hypothetical protein
MGVTGQRHDSAALYRGKGPPVTITLEPHSWSGHRLQEYHLPLPGSEPRLFSSSSKNTVLLKFIIFLFNREFLRSTYNTDIMLSESLADLNPGSP